MYIVIKEIIKYIIISCLSFSPLIVFCFIAFYHKKMNKYDKRT